MKNYFEWVWQRRRLKKQEERIDLENLDERLSDGFDLMEDDDPEDPPSPLITEDKGR